MYAGIYIETITCFTYKHSLMVLEQIELTPGSIYSLLKTLKQLLFDGFTNRLSKYKGHTSSIGVYISEKCFNQATNYTPATFYIVVKSSHLFSIHSDIVFPNIYCLDKIDFSYDETRKIFPNDPTINIICDIERKFWESTKTRDDTIKLLKQFVPGSSIKWYNFTETLKQRCLTHMRRNIINIIANNIKEETATKINCQKAKNVTSIV